MPLQTDIAGDFALFDSAYADVTLIQKRGAGDSPVQVRNATYGPLTNRQITALSNVGLVGKERNWSLNAIDVGAKGVEPGDVIDDGTNKWSVLSADLATLGNRWRCAARMLPS